MPRLTMEVSPEVAGMLRDLARREGVTRAEILRRGLLVVQAARQQREVGRPHLGFSTSAHAFDLELVGVLG